MVMSPSSTALRTDMPSMRPFAPERRAGGNARADPYGAGGMEDEATRAMRLTLQQVIPVPDTGPMENTEGEGQDGLNGEET